MPQVIYETAYVFYNAYKGPKCIYKTFIDRVRRRKLPMMEAIVPKAIPNTKRSPERIFYEEYQGTKACYWTYISRIGTGLSREEAILPEKRKPEFIRVYRAPTYTPTYTPTYKKTSSLLELWLILHSHQLKLKSFARNTKDWKLTSNIGWLPARCLEFISSLSRSWNIFRRR